MLKKGVITRITKKMYKEKMLIVFIRIQFFFFCTNLVTFFFIKFKIQMKFCLKKKSWCITKTVFSTHLFQEIFWQRHSEC